VLSGPGFSLTGSISADLPGEPHFRCFDCAPGSPLSLSSRYTSTTVEGIIGTVNGTDYRDIQAHFHFMAPTITVPDLPIGNTLAFITRPFSFTGTASGTNGTGNAFSLALIGSGMVTTTFIHAPQPSGIDAIGTDYAFTSSDPVPEPATLVLLTSGIGAIAATGRKRSRGSAA
jgi:PEP-CTERM motif-containing protein